MDAARERALGAAPLRLWSVDDVADWLRSLELAEHCAAFQRSAIDGQMLSELSGDDLASLGVKNKFHARKIVQRRDKLAGAAAGSTPAKGSERGADGVGAQLGAPAGSVAAWAAAGGAGGVAATPPASPVGARAAAQPPPRPQLRPLQQPPSPPPLHLPPPAAPPPHFPDAPSPWQARDAQSARPRQPSQAHTPRSLLFAVALFHARADASSAPLPRAERH